MYMLKKYVKLLLLVLTSVAYVGCSEDPYDWTKGQNSISATNIELSDISTNSAYLSFDLKVGSGIKIERLWVECKIGNYAKPERIFEVEPVINGRCKVKLTDLVSKVSYNTEIHATITDATSSVSKQIHSNVIWLQTLQLEDLMPTPTSLNLIPDQYSSNIIAKCNLIRHESDAPITEAGFYYGTNQSVTFSTGSHVVGNIDNETISAIISNLNIDTDYYIGAYVTTKLGTLSTAATHIKTGGINMTLFVSSINANTKGFSIKFELPKIPSNITVQNVIIKAARKTWLELYGQEEGSWDLAANNIFGVKDVDTYIYDLSKINLTGTWMLSKEEYIYWFTIKWLDSNSQLHTTTLNNNMKWIITTK